MKPIPLPNPSTQYHKGATFALYVHTAPTPTGESIHDMDFTDGDRELEAQTNGRLKHCIQYIVQPGAQYPTQHITLRKGLSVGLSHLQFAQVWMVECEGRTMVARFYDPLYVSDDTRAYHIFRQIDELVGTEVAAYTSLSKFQGTLIPCFVGHFLAMIPAPPGLEDQFPKRSVHVVLLEFVAGETLLALAPRPHDTGCDPQRDIHFTFVCEEHKNAIMDAICLADHLLVLHGVRHEDLVERNVVLKEIMLSRTTFCALPECALQHRFSTESLIMRLESLAGGEPVDYSKLTTQEIDSLPIAVIDFGNVSLVEKYVEILNESKRARFGARYKPCTVQSIIDKSRPDSAMERPELYRLWRLSQWLPTAAHSLIKY